MSSSNTVSNVPDIYQSFSGKSVFFTGVTGFVGKVFLFKILKEFPDIGKIYCLCRPKKGVPMQDRFAKEVLSSPCFTPLIKQIGEEEWKRRSAQCVAVAGDITHHRLGLSDADYQTLCNDVNIIVHMAATVDFQEKLHLSCEMNVLGSIRVMALAHKCKFLESYIHTSTCYVNYNKNGSTPVKEQLYPLPFDPEAMLKYILSLNETQIPAETKRLLDQYGFPNTYTFTKNIGEHILMKQRGNLPFTIVRPAIIGCAWREPYCGWVDALTAAGGIFLVSGLGLLHEMIGDGNLNADVVPVDHVVNLILKVTHRSIVMHKPTSYGRMVEQGSKSKIATIVNVTSKGVAEGAAGFSDAASVAPPRAQVRAIAGSEVAGSNAGESDPGALTTHFPRVYQSSTSNTMNPFCWNICTHSICGYWNNLKHPKSLDKSYVNFFKNKYTWFPVFYAKRILPVKLLLALKKVPGLQNLGPKEKLLIRFQKATKTVQNLNEQFAPFTTKVWYYETNNALDYLENGLLSEKAKSAFSTDVFDINWYHYGIAYSWGMLKFIMKDDSIEQPPMPLSGTEKVMKSYL